MLSKTDLWQCKEHAQLQTGPNWIVTQSWLLLRQPWSAKVPVQTWKHNPTSGSHNFRQYEKATRSSYKNNNKNRNAKSKKQSSLPHWAIAKSMSFGGPDLSRNLCKFDGGICVDRKTWGGVVASSRRAAGKRVSNKAERAKMKMLWQ